MISDIWNILIPNIGNSEFQYQKINQVLFNNYIINE